MTQIAWHVERALKALELAAKHIADSDCTSCPCRKGCDSFNKGGCVTYISKYYIRKTRGLKR